MEKSFLAIILVIIIISFLTILNKFINLTGYFVGFGPAYKNFEWWNVSWKYRVRVDINASIYDRVDWPIELTLNFTELLPSGTFDENSIRVIEYSSSGKILYEIPSQFEEDYNYNASTNAVGTLVFILNGTTQANTKRIFFIYYDSIENGQKPQPNYASSGVNYTWDGKAMNVTNALLKFFIDTNFGENTSGIFRVEDIYQNVILNAELPNRTAEYIEYFNSTHNLTFDLRNNASFTDGPVRLIVEQIGDEVVLGNPSIKTNEARVVKRYYFYYKASTQSYGSFIKIYQKVNNLASYSIQRNSTPAGALALDVNRTIYGGILNLNFNSTDPYSWVWASGTGGEVVGIINLKEVNTQNYLAQNSSEYGRIGINLDSTTIPSQSYIEETSLVYFGMGGANAITEFLDIKNRYLHPVIINQSLPEQLYVGILPSTNATIYNRNEKVLIIVNLSDGDVYNVSKYVNATLDMGTTQTNDDITIELYDDGLHNDQQANDKIFANSFSLSNDATTGIWTINFSVYGSNYEFLNSTTYNFNVTDELKVYVNITNKKPMVNSIVNATVNVKNYREDSYIPNANLVCSYDSTSVSDITDYNNGTYLVNFTAPSEEGDYTLTCNASKNGNFGSGSDNFTVEPAITTVELIITPLNPLVYNITIFNSSYFQISVNATNTGNGTAYSTNISIEVLSGWSPNSSLEECGDLSKGMYCLKSFNITVPNGTLAGNYTMNVSVTWKNPNSSISTNKQTINVTVVSNPLIDVIEEEIFKEVADGYWNYIGNFTVLSIGNDVLSNITFKCISSNCNDFILDFVPDNITSLNSSQNYSVALNVSVPLGYAAGSYNLTINVSAENDGYDTFIANLIIPSKTNVSITTSIQSYYAFNVSLFENESFSFSATATNIGIGSARSTNITLTLPNNWYSNSTLENCNILKSNQTCEKYFSITIPNGTSPGNYWIYVYSKWVNPDNSSSSNSTSILVTVVSNPIVDVYEDFITSTIPDGTKTYANNFTVLSIGNDNLNNITFSCISGDCENLSVEFIPNNITSLTPGDNYSVALNVSVPLGYAAGSYNLTINVSAENDGYDTFILEINVPENRTWSLYPQYCEKSTQYPEGIACTVNVSNKGNTIINFTVYPETGNYTQVNETNFSIQRQSWHVFSITYNVTGIPPGIYNSTFTVDAVQADANPDKKNVKVSLVPYIPPLINISIVPSEILQNQSLRIFANVTDRSGSGIAWVKINVTRPSSGNIDSANMIFINSSGNLTRWYIDYPNKTGNQTWGETLERGVYNITVYASDNIGNEESKNDSFIVKIKLVVLASTLSDKYYQGDTASIYFYARNLTGQPIENVITNFSVINPNGSLIFTSQNFSTDEYGTISPLPTFSISSDAVLGNYTLLSSSTYYDNIVNRTVASQQNHTFQVLSRTISVSGLFADIETAIVWYPDNIMKFGILVYNGEGKPVDPDSMNLTVYDPAGNLYFSTNLSQMTKQSTGYYIYQYAMPPTTPTGMFLAVLNVSQGDFQTMKLKAFRVARGGPYDVRLVLLENEVPQGDYLDFIIVIENKGEVSQDVFVEYWVSSGDKTYFSNSEFVLTPALTNQSFTRTAFIYSDQPLGTYYLNLRVTYDTVQPPLMVNSTFLVVAKRVTNVTPQTQHVTYSYTVPYSPVPTGAFPTAAPKPTEKIQAKLMIARYNTNISVARGFTRMEVVVINNTGNVDLENVSIYIIGIPQTWFNVTPKTYKILPKGKSTSFVITFSIPSNTNPGSYSATLLASSSIVSDQKKINITVFKSMEEVVQNEINKVKKMLEDLIIDTKVAEREGKDVSLVYDMIDEVERKIKSAEDNLANASFEDALDNLADAKLLIERARDLLRKLYVVKAKPFIIPIWLIGLIVATVVSLGIIIVLRKRKVEVIRPWIIQLGKVVEEARKKKVAKKEAIMVEREKIMRMLEILEKERKEKLISFSAYRQMKRNLENKLKKLGKD